MKPTVFNYNHYEKAMEEIANLRETIAIKVSRIHELEKEILDLKHSGNDIDIDCSKILDLSDTETQRIKWFEELSELSQALAKGNVSNIAEEMADVYICLKQMELTYKITPVIINSFMDYKLARTIARLGGNNEP